MKGYIMITEKFNAVKNHIHTHRAKYAAAGTLTACVAIQINFIAKDWNTFLDDNDLTDAYYNPEEN